MKDLPLICPVSKQPLELNQQGLLVTSDHKYCYKVEQGILRLLPQDMLDYLVVIPARLESTRFKQKLIQKIADKPLLYYTVNQALQSSASQVIVAADSQLIIDEITPYFADQPRLKLTLTDVQHNSGTSRIAQVINDLKIDQQQIIINLQGDEPLVDPSLLQDLAQALHDHPQQLMATVSAPLNSDDFDNPNVVKLVTDINNDALYFSRSLLPYPRVTLDSYQWQRHLGIYGYRAGFVSQYLELSESPLELIESLEQLRVLYHGYKIKVVAAKIVPELGVDTSEDFARLVEILTKHN